MRRIIFFVVLLMIFIYFNSVPTKTEEKSITVVWRVDSGQYYSFDQYSTLVSDLRENNINATCYNASVLFSNATSSIAENYFGSPEEVIIVIPNPPNSFYEKELEFLKTFVESGGNIMIMGDIQYDDRHYGKPDYLNELLDYLGASQLVKFWGTNDNGDEIKDNQNNYGLPWQVVVTEEYFKPHKIVAGIKKTVINSASLEVYNPDIIVATSPSTSYAEDTSGESHTMGEIPWLVAFDHNNRKIVVCGSSKMFSDTLIYGTSTPYIKAENNEQLFFNIIWWFTDVRLVAPEPYELIGILDIFPIVAGFISGIMLRKEEKIDYKTVGVVSAIIAVLYGLIATIQVAIFGQVIIGTVLPGWGEVVKTGGDVPAEAIAFVRYLFAGFSEVFFGLIIFLFVEWLDRYLDLGIMKKLGVKYKGEEYG